MKRLMLVLEYYLDQSQSLIHTPGKEYHSQAGSINISKLGNLAIWNLWLTPSFVVIRASTTVFYHIFQPSYYGWSKGVVWALFWQQITWAGQMGVEQINWGKCNGRVDDCQQSQKLGKLLSCKMPTMSLFNLFLDIIWISCQIVTQYFLYQCLVSTTVSHLLSLLCCQYAPPWLSLVHQELKKSHAAVKTKWPQVKSVAILATSETCSRFIRAIQFIHSWRPFVHSIGFLGREEARSASSICSPCHSARHSTFKGRWCSPRHTCTSPCYISLFSGCFEILQ